MEHLCSNINLQRDRVTDSKHGWVQSGTKWSWVGAAEATRADSQGEQTSARPGKKFAHL